VRRYLDKPVEREKIARCLEAARLSPSTSNSQPWRFVVVDDPDLRTTVARQSAGPLGSFNTFAAQAPVLVAVVTEAPNVTVRIGGLLKTRDYSLIDIGIAAVQFCLQATELGLGTCLIGWFDERGVKRALGIPRDRRVHLLVTLGYPVDPLPRPKRRKSLGQIHAYNRYQE
jgi:nitroreductase